MEALRNGYEWADVNIPGGINGMIGFVLMLVLTFMWKGVKAFAGRFQSDPSPAYIAAAKVLDKEDVGCFKPEHLLLECVGLTVRFHCGEDGKKRPAKVEWVRTGDVHFNGNIWSGTDIEPLVSSWEMRSLKSKALKLVKAVIDRDKKEKNEDIAKLISGASSPAPTISRRTG